MLMNSFRFRAGLLACVTTFLAGAAAAQTAPPPKVGVEEVTVTAQKRSENVRKVPVSVSVLSGRLIKADHITNFADLTRAVPNLSFSSQAGEGLSTLEIRGIASQAGQATVAIYLDDVSLTTRNIYTEGTTEPRFLDISRIEVLRGPQATLYGASALGGTLRYISNPPKMDVYEGNVSTELSGTYHGGLNWDEQGVLNIPIAQDKAALRIAGETGGDSGYINDVNPATGQTVKANINSNGFDAERLADHNADGVLAESDRARCRCGISGIAERPDAKSGRRAWPRFDPGAEHNLQCRCRVRAPVCHHQQLRAAFPTHARQHDLRQHRALHLRLPGMHGQ
jgi:outer membrane receptor protein involved in Fe transport